jgi:hypothetical protein
MLSALPGASTLTQRVVTLEHPHDVRSSEARVTAGGNHGEERPVSVRHESRSVDKRRSTMFEGCRVKFQSRARHRTLETSCRALTSLRLASQLG